MAQMRKDNVTGGVNGGKNYFPPEAYACTDDVDSAVVKTLRDKLSVDFDSDEWETIDGFGQVVNA